MREIEIRIKLNEQDKELLFEWLSKNAQETKRIHHVEWYLDNPKSTFFIKNKNNIVDAADYLRVRKTAKVDSVCLKRFEVDPQSLESKNIDEIEYDVSSAEEAFKVVYCFRLY